MNIEYAQFHPNNGMDVPAHKNKNGTERTIPANRKCCRNKGIDIINETPEKQIDGKLQLNMDPILEESAGGKLELNSIYYTGRNH